MKPTFKIMRAKDGQFYFVLIAKNGEVLLQSETYTQRHNAIKGIAAVVECAPEAIIEDRSDEEILEDSPSADLRKYHKANMTNE